MKGKKLPIASVEAIDLPALFDKEGIEFQPIQNVNWAEYSYRPDVQFRIAHTEDAFLLHFKVTEASVRAQYGKDDGDVWTDSCVEFFCIPGGDGVYYNLECNCIGTILIGAGPERGNRLRATEEVTGQVKRWATLGNQPFEERLGECAWEVALVVPYSAFFLHQIKTLDGQIVPANFYKCGDELQTPHFLSWNPIPIEKPDFHRPDHFGKLEME